jgi:hypothetical protein
MARRGGGRPTVEGSIILDVRDLRATRLGPSCPQSGTLQWTRTHSSPPICQAEYYIAPSDDAAILRLTSITRFDTSGRPIRMEGQAIRLVATIPPFGGRRWWFLCPHSGRRVMKLHLPFGARVFASRQAYQLGYTVQRESAEDQAYRRARKARARIGGGPNLMERLPAKPKWMRWATYWRHVDACQRAERDTLEFLAANAEKILGWPTS